ncbi:MAG: tRNA dihydrouridine synthase DusB [Oscillospiraceae bacterium]|nr:tRNA dihydrouridine synthase DusB [Oscillospiraceae bacterium]
MVRIGDVEIYGLLALAPMAGVSDIAFREVCKRAGAAYTCTEMVSAKALSYGDIKTKSLLHVGEGEHPCAAQIFGSDPEIMGEAAGLAREISGADVIDINMGCPVGKVAGNGDGCALMREPDKAQRIIEAVVRGAGVPVTVKFRKGWDKGSVNAVEFGRMCEEAGASAITVHGRTRTQMYSGVADWDIIRDVKKAVGIPVFANGDVFEPEDAVRILRYTGCDMTVVGRGAFGNPWIFTMANALLHGERPPAMPPLSERMDTAVEQFEASKKYKGEKIACLEARKHLAWYLHGVPHSGYYRAQAVRVETFDDIYDLIKLIKRELR